MGPDSREAFEIGFLVFGVTRIVPEFDRHRGKRRTTDEFSFFLKNRIPLRIKSSGVHAEAFALKLSGIHREIRISSHETSDQVRAASNRHQWNSRMDFFIEPFEEVFRQGGTR